MAVLFGLLGLRHHLPPRNGVLLYQRLVLVNLFLVLVDLLLGRDVSVSILASSVYPFSDHSQPVLDPLVFLSELSLNHQFLPRPLHSQVERDFVLELQTVSFSLQHFPVKATVPLGQVKNPSGFVAVA